MASSTVQELASELRRFTAPAIVLAIAAAAVAAFGWQTDPPAAPPDPQAAEERTEVAGDEGDRTGQPVVHLAR